ncbi:MAG: type II toxin-antitoxin system HicB family antitoxin [Firmicutes bacterium]|nr:type II toxin-antitoxin system HicB family antitoxin [Bacillota bacterium]
MMKYVYPAIFTKEDEGYSVFFPDLEGCYTCGDNLEDALRMAEDVLAFTLYDYEKESKEIPNPSDLKTLEVESNEFANYISCDTIEYRKTHNNKAVKKTLTVPEWLNEEATAKGINFSATLQEALKTQLGL